MKQRKEYQKEYVITEESKKDVNKFYEKKKLNAINKKVYIFDDYYEVLINKTYNNREIAFFF